MKMKRTSSTLVALGLLLTFGAIQGKALNTTASTTTTTPNSNSSSAEQDGRVNDMLPPLSIHVIRPCLPCKPIPAVMVFLTDYGIDPIWVLVFAVIGFMTSLIVLFFSLCVTSAVCTKEIQAYCRRYHPRKTYVGDYGIMDDVKQELPACFPPPEATAAPV